LGTREELLGRAVVADGRLQQLREDLGLTRSAMAELVHTTAKVYTSWESNPGVRMWPSTASRCGRFYTNAIAELDYVRTVLMIDVSELIPLYLAATLMGTAQDRLLRRYRAGEFEAEDLGVLGLWMHRSTVEEMRQ
jgi:DNA-binding XRE family transcriptional regulator